MLNEIQVGSNDDVKKITEARFIHESDENNLRDASDMYAENELAMKRNEAVLNSLHVLNDLFNVI